MMIHFAVTSQQFRINFIPAEFNRNSAANYTDDNAFTIQLIQAFVNIHVAAVKLPDDESKSGISLGVSLLKV